MPLYDFCCEDCQHIFEVRASIKDHEAGLHPICPQCQSSLVQQVLSAGLFIRGENTAVCAPDAAPGCCQTIAKRESI